MPEWDHFEVRQPVNPYVCSTPNDFAEEKDFLNDVIFPQLNDLCRLRGSHFDPCDLRWRPGDAKTESGLLLKTQLDAIKKASPYFICILGETYGPYRPEDGPTLPEIKGPRELKSMDSLSWLDKNFLLAGSSSHSWVLQEAHQHSSVTELEVTQAAFLCDGQHSTIYYRMKDEHLDHKLAQLPGWSEVDRNQLLATHGSESEFSKMKIHDLRQRLVKRGVPVKYFSTPEELGREVLTDWRAVIDIALPPLLHDVALLDTLQYREWLAQQSFINSRSDVFLSSDDIEDLLDHMTEFAESCGRAEVSDFAEICSQSEGNSKIRSYSATSWIKKQHQPVPIKTKSILLLSGDRGVGKSTLASRWLRSFIPSNICVISHFVSASSGSTDISVFMKQVIRQLRQRYLLSDGYSSLSISAEVESSLQENGQDFRYLCEAFVASIGLGPCVILVDGLNELGPSHGLTAREVKEFSWLPDDLPATCKLIVTTLKSDISHRNLVKRLDVVSVVPPDSLTNTNFTVEMLKEHEPAVSQLVGGEDEIKQLSNLKVMQTSLGSRVIASELTCFCTYSNYQEFVETSTEIWSLRNFWVSCLQRWVHDHSWQLDDLGSEVNFVDNGFDYTGWVTDSLCLIALSRNGLTQSQLLSMLRDMGYVDSLEVTAYDWLQFRLYAGATLRQKADGRVIFGFKYLQEIAEYLFFKNMSSGSRDAASIVKDFEPGLRQSYHEHLAKFFSKQLLTSQVIEELPWQLMLAGDLQALLDFLTDCGVLLKMLCGDSELWHQDLRLYWEVCELKGQPPSQVYLQLCQSLGVVDISDIQVYAANLSEENTPMSMSPRPDSPRVSTPQPGQSFVLEHSEQFQGSMVYLEDEATMFEKDECVHHDNFSEDSSVTQVHSDASGKLVGLSEVKRSTRDNFPGLATLTFRLAFFLQSLGQHTAAASLFFSLVKFIKKNYPLELGQQVLLVRCHFCLGQLYEREGEPPGAEREYLAALQALEEADDMDVELSLLQDIKYLKGLLLSCNGRLKVHQEQLFEAEELLKEALESVSGNPDCFGLKSSIQYNLGQLRASQGDFLRAESSLRESARLRGQWFGRLHPLIADVLVALGHVLADKSNIQGRNEVHAERLFRQALAVRESCLDSQHLAVAAVLVHLGELLSEEQSHPAKVEAQKLLRTALDIRTTELGGHHPLTMATQESLTRLDVALKLGHYDFGAARPAERRSHNQPFSALTFRDSDLQRLRRTPSRQSKVDSMHVRSVSRQEVIRHDRPDSMVSSVTCDRLLSAAERPRLLRRGQNGGLLYSKGAGECQYQTESLAQIHDTNIIIGQLDSKGRKIISEDENCEPNSYTEDYIHDVRGSLDDHLVEEPTISVDVQSNTTGDVRDIYSMDREETTKKSVSIRPPSGPRRMFQRFGAVTPENLAPSRQSASSQRKLSGSRRVWSGRSNVTGVSTATSGHQSRCSVPGRHDVTLSNNRSIAGPNSSLYSLLADGGTPRAPGRQIQHRSAWYHVPGRYKTPRESYPRKRNQQTENAKDIEAFLKLKAQWIKKKHHDLIQEKLKELQLNPDPNSGYHHRGGVVSAINDHVARNMGQVSAEKSQLRRRGSDTPRLMISGLDMVPESRYHDDTRISPQQQVKFKEPIVCG